MPETLDLGGVIRGLRDDGAIIVPDWEALADWFAERLITPFATLNDPVVDALRELSEGELEELLAEIA